MNTTRTGSQHCVVEWAFTSHRAYAEPGGDLEVDVVFAHAGGERLRVPAYWAGGQEWCVRFAPPLLGQWTWETACSDATNPELHGQRGALAAVPYTGENPLPRRGPLRVNAQRSGIEHADGTPFVWLADLWWHGMSARLRWPEEFRRLAADRAAKGFSVVQIPVGFSCDTPPFDLRGANEAGHPWEPGYARINPAYFDLVDLRVEALVAAGLVPCLVGCFGFYLPWMGLAKMTQHWRYLMARYGAYPVVWCLAGCGAMPYYLSPTPEVDRAVQKAGWTEVARMVRRSDPYGHIVTIHPTDAARDQVDDAALLDVDMLQAGWGGPGPGRMVERIVASAAREPSMPVLIGEAVFEGRTGGNWQDVQRLMFWAAMLSGAAGYTYCAEGLWQVNRAEAPFGPSPMGMEASDTPWQEASQYPGAAQVGLGRQLLARYGAGSLERHPEWIVPHADAETWMLPYAGGIPGRLRLFYFPRPVTRWSQPPVRLVGLEEGAKYRATYWDPRNGREHPLGEVTGPEWPVPMPPRMHDWLLILERQG